mmetsp:Transcript_77601/g.146521  ORF Transcript_77601/g.146521 Transcript_77601/m.146521 type:complete len:143 (-) Transcript_77601:26-454(-)
MCRMLSRNLPSGLSLISFLLTWTGVACNMLARSARQGRKGAEITLPSPGAFGSVQGTNTVDYRHLGNVKVSPGKFCETICNSSPSIDNCRRSCYERVNPVDFCSSICPGSKSNCVTGCEAEMYRCLDDLECMEEIAQKYSKG